MDNNIEADSVYAFDSDDDVCHLDEHQADVHRLNQLKINDFLSLDSYEDIDKRNPFVCKEGIFYFKVLHWSASLCKPSIPTPYQWWEDFAGKNIPSGNQKIYVGLNWGI